MINELPFSITARTAILLGRENISSPIVAVLELVKNAYDADAEKVIIRFRKASLPEGTIEIIDNGHGMSWDDINTKWMVIGTDNKLITPVSPKGRLKVGEKGIGRFALDRLATQTVLETTPLHAPNEPTYRLTINWDKFVNAAEPLHKVLHPIVLLKRQKHHGTHLILSGLRDRWNQQAYERLYRDLVVLIPPFEKRLSGFSVNFDCDEVPSLTGRIRSPMTEAAIFKIYSKLDEENLVNISITTRNDSPDGKFRLFKRYKRNWFDLFDAPEEPMCGPLEFEFYFYLRDAPGVKGTEFTLRQLREYLDIYGGVRIYRDGFRVKPYGDPGGEGDWLGLSARRVKHPAGVASKTAGKWVVAENQVAAALFISRKENPALQDQTNREGLIENQAFRDARAFALKCIEIFEDDRKQYELSKKREEPASVKSVLEDALQSTSETIEEMEDIVSNLSDRTAKISLLDAASKIREAQLENLQKLEEVYEEEQHDTISKYQLLQNAATIGIAISAMGHEILETSRQVIEVISRLQKRLKSTQLLVDEKVEEYMERLQRYGQIMHSISYFALGHIDRDKRTRRKLNANDVISDLYNNTLIELGATNTAVIDFIPGNVPDIYAFPYEIESIIINFVTNAFAAFRRGHTPTTERRIEIETNYDTITRQIKIIARDSGPGIPKGDKDRIFGIYSTKIDDLGRPIGTGLGLLIIKDIVESHKGTLVVKEHGDRLPGAEFMVSLPISRERGADKEIEDG
jgi:signal transduction histidine kinase